MPGNTDPIYSRVGVIQGAGIVLTTAANDYTGLSPYNVRCFVADSLNGGYIERLRFKPLGTNVASVARVFLNPGIVGHMAALLTTPAAPTGTPSASGGTMLSGTSVFVAKIVAVDANGCLSAVGTESSTVTVAGPTGSIAWTWTAVTGAVSYRIYTGHAGAGSEAGYWTSSTNSYTQIAMAEGSGWTDGVPTATNNIFYGEIGLAATTLSASAPLQEIDYPMSFALPAGWEVYVGLGTAVAAGWAVSAIGGAY